MARRINSIGLCAIVLLCILLIFASHRMTFSPFTSNESDATNQFNHLGHISDHRRANNGKYYQIMQGGGGVSGSRQYANRKASGTSGAFGASGEIATMSTNTAYNTTVRIEDVINEQRQLILDEMKDFEYTEKTLNLGALTPETGGRPVQSGNYFFPLHIFFSFSIFFIFH